MGEMNSISLRDLNAAADQYLLRDRTSNEGWEAIRGDYFLEIIFLTLLLSKMSPKNRELVEFVVCGPLEDMLRDHPGHREEIESLWQIFLRPDVGQVPERG